MKFDAGWREKVIAESARFELPKASRPTTKSLTFPFRFDVVLDRDLAGGAAELRCGVDLSSFLDE